MNLNEMTYTEIKSHINTLHTLDSIRVFKKLLIEYQMFEHACLCREIEKQLIHRIELRNKKLNRILDETKI